MPYARHHELDDREQVPEEEETALADFAVFPDITDITEFAELFHSHGESDCAEVVSMEFPIVDLLS